MYEEEPKYAKHGPNYCTNSHLTYRMIQQIDSSIADESCDDRTKGNNEPSYNLLKRRVLMKSRKKMKKRNRF